MKVLIDTNIIKFSATERMELIPVNKKIRNWYGKVIGFQRYIHGLVNPNDKLPWHSEVKYEAGLLPKIAELAKMGEITLIEDIEMLIESMGVKKIGSQSGRLYGAPIGRAVSPVKYGRVIIGPKHLGFDSPDKMTENFLSSIQNTRFKEFQKIVGAYQGKNGYKLNQLIDAYLLWSAEENSVDAMLTIDLKLIKMLRGRNGTEMKFSVVTPSELLSLIKSKHNEET